MYILFSAAIVGFCEYFALASKGNEDAADPGWIIGLVFTVITVVIVSLIYYYRDKIYVAIVLIEEGSKWVRIWNFNQVCDFNQKKNTTC